MTKTKVISIIFIGLFAFSCKKNPKGIDGELFSLSKESAGFVWYKNSEAYLEKSAGSGHNFPFLRTRFNTIAATQLDVSGKILENAVFPEGSVVVKELYNSDNELQRYATLYKKSDSEFADANGWVWGYIEKNGKVVESAELKGASCIGCHTQGGNIDYMLMNAYFP
jgi:hypothetical protein